MGGVEGRYVVCVCDGGKGEKGTIEISINDKQCRHTLIGHIETTLSHLTFCKMGVRTKQSDVIIALRHAVPPV